ncbi:MAG: hypothetical protein Q7U97_07530 [Rhodocyclaceae bacterium]|nr:hypothetical protein [Rhodocyclaceae bacterium]
MKPTRFQRLLIVLTALWLPLQAVASIAMPACRHDAAAQSAPVAAVADGDEHCPNHAAEAAPAGTQHEHDQSCDNCGICHLACAGYMPASCAATVGVTPPDRIFSGQAATAPPSNIPEPPQHPPKRSA